MGNKEGNVKRKKHRGEEIERRLQKDFQDEKNHIKLLVLGTGDSGKSTFVKQINIIYNNGFSEKTKMLFKNAIQSNYILYGKALINAVDDQNVSFSIKRNGSYAKKFLATKETFLDHKQKNLKKFLKSIWKDESVKKVFDEYRNLYQIPDSFGYFLDNLGRCTEKNYTPNNTDILNCRIPTTGINSVEFHVANYPWVVVDVGGQRSERKKWIHQFEDVSAIVFVVAMSEYNQELYEEKGINRMHEALELFDSIMTLKYFYKTNAIILFNKMDLFEEKVKKVPITECFPEFVLKDKDKVFEESRDYIKDKFLRIAESEEREVISLYTTATETESIQEVFDNIQYKVLEQHLKQLEML